ncbi:caspase family protein [Putridiphycobacter roseus]|nr:caspase family protein [Putridiphycobacter roseus]
MGILRIFLISFLSLIVSNIQAQDIEVITQQKSNGVISVMAYSPDGALLAVGGKGDHDIKVWDIVSGKIIGTLSGHQASVNAIQFNEEGTKIISGGADKKVIIWDVLQWEIADSVTTIAVVNDLTRIENGTFYSGHEDGSMVTWNANDISKPSETYLSDGSILKLKRFQQYVGFTQSGGNLSIFDTKSKALLIKKKVHPISILGFDFDPNSKQIITVGVEGKINFLNLESLEESKQQKTGSLLINAYDIDVKNKLFAITNASRTIKLFNFEGKELQSFKGNSEDDNAPISAVKISPDGTILASSGSSYVQSIKGRKGVSVVKLWDLKRGVYFQDLKGEVNPVYTFDFHPSENKLVLLGDENMLSFWDLNTASLFGNFKLPDAKREIPPRQKNITLKKGAKFLDKARMVANGDLGALTRDSDMRSMASTVLKRSTIEKDLLLYGQTGKYLFTKLRHDEIRQYDMQGRKPEAMKTLFAYQPNINEIVTDKDDAYMAVLGSGDSAVSIINLTTGEFVKKLSTPAPSQGLKYLYEAQSATFSPDGKYLAVCFNTSKTYVWRVGTWTQVFENFLPGNLGYTQGPFVNFSKDGNSFIINTMAGLKVYNTKAFDLFADNAATIKGHALPISKPCDYIAAIENDFLYFENVNTKKVVKSIRLKPYMVTNVASKSNGKIGVTLTNGQFFILDPATGEEDIMLVSNGENSIIKTYDNYYKVNKEGYKLVTFRIGNKAYPFEQFDAIYNRPDLVLKKLECDDAALINLYERAYEKRIAKLGINPKASADFSKVPNTKVTNKSSLQAIVNSNTVSLNISMDDQLGLQSYNIWVNNVPLYGKTGKVLGGKTKSTAIVKIELVSGTNKIQVACRNKNGVESLLETMFVESVQEAEKPSIYMVTIGTSKYADAQYNLNYAAKDAQDLDALFKTNKNGMYQSVNTKTLTDEMVNTENVLALKTFLSQAKINDIVIVFVAGHGVLDQNFDYYFATHPMVFNNPKLKGMAYEDLESLLDEIKAKKKILIMDTCHSGEVEKDEVFFAEEEDAEINDVSFRSAGVAVAETNASASPSKAMNELFNDLRRGTGATVISSAGGAEFALESDEWKNGLFSYCLLSGLKEGYADLNKDGEIYLTELQTYTIEKVKALSHGKQVPNSRLQNLELDFRIW